MAATSRFKPLARWRLVLIGAGADFAEPVEENSAAERILLLTLVEADVATTAQLGTGRFGSFTGYIFRGSPSERDRLHLSWLGSTPYSPLLR